MEIVNIVTSGSLNQRVNLQLLSDSLDTFDYDPESYHGGYLRLSKYSVTIYSSGKYIVPGVKSFNDLQMISDEIRYVLSGVMDASIIGDPEVKNIVAMTSVPSKLDLVHLFTYLVNVLGESDVSYEPESFPGLIWKSKHGTANIYRSGKIVLLGTSSIQSLVDLEKFVLSNLQTSDAYL